MYNPSFERVVNKAKSLVKNVPPVEQQLAELKDEAHSIPKMQKRAMDLVVAGTISPLESSLAEELANAKPLKRKVVEQVLPDMQEAMTRKLNRNNYRLKPFDELANAKLNKLPPDRLPTKPPPEQGVIKKFIGKYIPNFNK